MTRCWIAQTVIEIAKKGSPFYYLCPIYDIFLADTVAKQPDTHWNIDFILESSDTTTAKENKDIIQAEVNNYERHSKII